MKKTMASMLIVAALSGINVQAFAQNAPVTVVPENPTAKTTTVVTDPESGTTKVTIEEEPTVYDAITGEPVDPAEALGTKEEEPQSLRDEVRSKMDGVQ